MSEFYTDGGEELENVPVDPNAPKPEGSTISPAVGEQLIVPSGQCPKRLVNIAEIRNSCVKFLAGLLWGVGLTYISSNG